MCILYLNNSNNNLLVYTLIILTGSATHDGTSNSVYVSLTGPVSSTAEQEVEGAGFNEGQNDTFSITTSTDIGLLECVQFRLGGSDGWEFEKVR